MNAGRSQWLTAVISWAGLAAMLGTAHAATPAQNCQSGKNKAAGTYASCRQNAEAKFATSLDGVKRTADLVKCETKYRSAWTALEAKAVKKGGVCPSVGDQAAVQGAVDQQTGNVATALAGGVVQVCSVDLATCQGSLGTCSSSLTTTQGNLTTCTGNLTTCQNDLAACQTGGSSGQLLKTGQTLCYNAAGTVIACAGTGQDGEFQKGLAHSYTDNGDGTITDNRTGLMWEKLSDDGSIHDKDSAYPWTAAVPGKIAALNSGSFAGFTDWRLPNSIELYSLVNLGAVNPVGLGAVNPAVFSAFNTSCAASCTVMTCSCTQPDGYWSASTNQYIPETALYVFFGTGALTGLSKSTDFHVRGVRGGS